MLFGQISIAINSQILTNTLVIWSHCREGKLLETNVLSSVERSVESVLEAVASINFIIVSNFKVNNLC